ncbi:MAG: hypothetical protein IK109_09750 [Clostridiales bacterium]|nr:hypothetical protein [Clostridiales bacterium]
MAESSTNSNKLVIWGMIYWFALSLSFAGTLQISFSATFPLDFNIFKFGLATIAVWFMLMQVPRDDSAFSINLLIILYLVVFPIGVIYSCQDRETFYFLSVAICMVLVESLVKKLEPAKFVFGSRDHNLSNTFILGFFVLLMLSVFAVYRERGVPGLDSLNFMNTYKIRSSYTLSSLASVLFNMATKAIVPFLIAVFFLKKKYKIVFVLLGVQFVFFLWLANKTTVFSIGVLVIGYIVAKVKNGSLKFSKIMCAGVISISVLENLMTRFSPRLGRYVELAYSITVRRTLYLPGYLKYSYYDYFVINNNPHNGLFGTFVAPILTRMGFSDPYQQMPYTKVIGNEYYLEGSSANTGMFGTELAHFGYFGIFVAAVLIALFLFCVKKCESTNGKIFTCCLTIYTVFSLTDAGAIQMIDFSPMFLIALILYFFNFKKEDYDEDSHSCRSQTAVYQSGGGLEGN